MWTQSSLIQQLQFSNNGLPVPLLNAKRLITYDKAQASKKYANSIKAKGIDQEIPLSVTRIVS